MRTENLDLGVLKTFLDYNPETGIFVWKVAKLGWRPAGSIAGTLAKSGYRYLTLNKVIYRAHRLAWFYFYGKWPSGFLDHKNRDRDDNRIENLREANQSQNVANGRMRSTNKSGYRGVSWSKKSRKWVAMGWENRKQKSLGYYDDPKEAASAYQRHADQHHGEFAAREKMAADDKKYRQN